MTVFEWGARPIHGATLSPGLRTALVRGIEADGVSVAGPALLIAAKLETSAGEGDMADRKSVEAVLVGVTARSAFRMLGDGI